MVTLASRFPNLAGICSVAESVNTAHFFMLIRITPYLQTHHAARSDLIATVDAVRVAMGQVPISQLDSATKYTPSVHMTGDNASPLIYACAMADFAAIDRDRFDIVAVTGNSMGWYLALACAGILDLAGGARLVNNMGARFTASGADFPDDRGNQRAAMGRGFGRRLGETHGIFGKGAILAFDRSFRREIIGISG